MSSRISTCRMSFTRQRSLRSRLVGRILPGWRPPSLALALLAASLAGVAVRRTRRVECSVECSLGFLGYVLRRRVDPLRGGANRLRCLCLRSQSHRLHADLGRLQHHRGEPPRDLRIGRRRDLSLRLLDLGTLHDSASSTTTTETGLRRIFIAWRYAAPRPAGWCRWRRPG
jgi:hypothetical protein